jgi:hypothetical protein
MNQLIKNILREFVNKMVSFEVVGNYLTEEENNKKFVPTISQEIRELIKSRLSFINPFIGVFVDKKTGAEKKIEFEIIPTKHYLDRLFRKDDPKHANNQKLTNPFPLEGLNFLYDNRDRLAEEIVTKRINDGDVVVVKRHYDTLYSVVVSLDKKNAKNIPLYHLHLKTQIKGDDFYGKRGQKDLKIKNPSNI